MQYTREEYLSFDPFGDERDVDIRCKTRRIVKARKKHLCMSPDKCASGTIEPGELYVKESAIVDDIWGNFGVCIPCMDRMIKYYWF